MSWTELKRRLAAWYARRTATAWYKTYTIWACVAALAAPELLNLFLANLDFFFGLLPQTLSPETKLEMQRWLILGIAVSRIIRQANLGRPKGDKS